MTSDEVKTIVQRRPFRPFVVRLNSGDAFAFRQPEELGATQDGRTIFYFSPNGGFALLDAVNIAAIVEQE